MLSETTRHLQRWTGPLRGLLAVSELRLRGENMLRVISGGMIWWLRRAGVATQRVTQRAQVARIP